MKKIILLAAALMMVGCGIERRENGEPILDYYNYHSACKPYTQVIDSCEYICWYDRMAHKGNYRFCKERTHRL